MLVVLKHLSKERDRKKKFKFVDKFCNFFFKKKKERKLLYIHERAIWLPISQNSLEVKKFVFNYIFACIIINPLPLA